MKTLIWEEDEPGRMQRERRHDGARQGKSAWPQLLEYPIGGGGKMALVKAKGQTPQ